MPQTIETDELLSRVIKIAEGRHAGDKFPDTNEWTVEQFVNRYFKDFKVGPKNGAYILQGSLVSEATRCADSVDANYIIMLDHDSGETMDEVAEKIEAAGFTAVLWHTHSHMTTTSTVAETGFIKYWDADAGEGEDEDEDEKEQSALRICARKYLLEEKAVRPYIADSITHVEKVHVPVTPGQKAKANYVITHAPMHKLRSLFMLDEPFKFVLPGVGSLQRDRQHEWKSRYRGFAEKLGAFIDTSTVDASRLMYTPRIPPGADRNNYEIRFIEGGLVTLDDMPLAQSPAERLREERRIASDLLRELGIANDTRPGTSFKTPGLGRFLKKYGRGFAASQWLAHHTEVRRDVDIGKAEYECPLSHLHTEQDKPGGAAFFATDADHTNDVSWTMWCGHTTCKSVTVEDRAAFLDAACQKYGVAHADELINYVDHDLRELVNVDPDFVTNRAGIPIPNKWHNTNAAVECMALSFDYDAFKARRYIRNFDERPDIGPRFDDDAAHALLKHWAETYEYEPTLTHIWTFVIAQARAKRFDSLQDWLNALPAWDGEERVDTLLRTVAETAEEDAAVIEECTRIFMLGLISRALDPGCKFDYMLILEGKQGIRKSTFLRELMPHRDWFTDSLTLQDDEKKILEQTGGKWLIEIPELAGIGLADFNKMKANLTREEDNARMAYDRDSTERSRRFVVAASTNDSEYLRDTTGNRRYLPVRLNGQIDVAYVQENRDQLFAEALARYRAGEQPYPRDAMIPLLEAAQAARTEPNEYTGTLEPFFANVAGWVDKEDVHKLLGIEKGKDTRYAKKIAKAAMKLLGYEPVRARIGSHKPYLYVRLPVDWRLRGKESLAATKPDGTEGILPQITINEFAGTAVGGLPVDAQGLVIAAPVETKVVTGLFGKRPE